MVRNNKRGQAAMEFLMTYGWAILVVLAAIGALAYFGVLSPDNFLPSKCTIAPQFACTEWKVNTNGQIQLGLQNNVGSTVDVTVTMATTDCTLSDAIHSQSGVANGRKLNDTVGGSLVNFTCGAALSSNDKFQADLTFNYVESGDSLNHSVTGTLQTKVE